MDSEHVFFGDDVPEEIREKIRKQIDHGEMQTQEVLQSIKRFFKEMNVDQLVAFRYVLATIRASGAEQLSFYNGVAATHLEVRLDVCPDCGRDHETDALKLMTEVEDVRLDSSKVKTVIVPEEPEIPSVVDFLKEADNMAEYQVHGRQGVSGVFCDNCGFHSSTLEDRMLRPKGEHGCEGCQHKSAHG